MGMMGKIKASIIQRCLSIQYMMRMRGRRQWCATDLKTKLPQSKSIDTITKNSCKAFWESVLCVGGVK